MPPKPQKITTEVDLLMNLLKDVKEIPLEEAAKTLGIPVATLETWATFLEEERAISIKYKFTTPFLVYNQPVEVRKGRADIFAKRLEPPDESIERIDELILKAEDASKKGDFVSIKQALPALLSKAKSFKDSISLDPLKKSNVEKIIGSLDLSLQRANSLADSGKFDLAIKLYSEIQRELKDLLLSLKKTFAGTGQKSASTAPAEPGDIKQLIDRAYSLLSAGKVQEAREAYERLKEKHDTLPREYAERKLEIDKNLIKLNKDLSLALDRLAASQMAEGTKRIKSLISGARDAVNKADFAKAEEAYYDIKKVFDSLPAGFARDQKQLERQILALFEYLGNKRMQIFTAEIRKKEGEIKAIVRGINEEVKSGRIEKAISLYNEAKKIYDSLPSEFLKEKLAVQEQLMPLYTTLSSLYASKSSDRMGQIHSRIKELLGTMRVQIDSGTLSLAEETYRKINALFMELPQGFLNEKIELQNMTVAAYEYLLSKSKDYMDRTVSIQAKLVDKLLMEAFSYLKAGRHELAEEVYADVINAYGELAPGFAYERAVLRQKILELYRQILMSADVAILRTASAETAKNYQEILKLLVQSKRNMDSRQFALLEPDYHKIRKIFNELPLGFVQEKLKLRESVSELALCVDFYSKLMSIKEAMKEGKDAGRLVSEAESMKQALKMPDSKPLVDFFEEGKRANSQKPAQELQIAQRQQPQASQDSDVRSLNQGMHDITEKIARLKASAAPVIRMPGQK